MENSKSTAEEIIRLHPAVLFYRVVQLSPTNPHVTIALLSLSQYSLHALRENRFIVWLHFSRWQYTLFSWLLCDPVPVSQATYKQGSKWLVKSLSNGENIDNLTALHIHLHFTSGTNSVHGSSRAYGISVFSFFSYWLSSTNLCCSSSRSKTLRGLSIMCRLLRPVRVRLRRIHSGVIGLPTTLSGCVSSTLRNLIKYNFG